MSADEKVDHLGVLAGNGPLPGVLVEEALNRGLKVTVLAVKEESDPGLDRYAEEWPDRVRVEWIGLGQLGRLLKILRRGQVDHVAMVGQVRHKRIFAPKSRSPLAQLKHLPDLKMMRLLASLPRKNTSALIEGVMHEIEKEGVRFIDSTAFLGSLLADRGAMTRALTKEERADLDYGHPMAREIARLDIGQTIVVKEQAVVAVEAMEGTDATIRRAADIAGGERLTVIKVSRPEQDMRFDVPVIGPGTLEILKECAVSVLAIDAEKTIIIDKERVLEEAGNREIAIVGIQN